MTLLPDVLRDYVRIKINEGFCYLYQCLMELTIKKNKLLERLYFPMILGYISAPLVYVVAGIQYIEQGIEIAEDALNNAYQTIMEALLSMKVTGLCIPAESFCWACSPRSFMSPLPYANPDASKIFIPLPGGSSGVDLSVFKPLMPSALENIDISSIDTMLNKIMIPLTPVDYFLEPQLFQARYALSDQGKIVLNLRQQLEKILCGGPDYLPKFENLLPMMEKTYTVLGQKFSVQIPNIGYVWFLLGLMDAWAPHSMSLVGSYQNPAL